MFKLRCLAVVALLSFPITALAQTGPELLIRPWGADQRFDGAADLSIEARGHTENPAENHPANNAGIQISQYETYGRYRLFPREAEVRADPRFGFDVNYIDINSNDRRLPKQLTDESAALGVGVLDYQGWLGGLTLAAGYAGAGAFQDGNGYYAKADFILGRELSKTSQVAFVLDYNGNRSILPDVPLPGAEYRKQLDPTLLLAVGFPLCSIDWTPDKSYTLNRQLTVSATYEIPDSLNALVSYALIDSAGPLGQLGLYLRYEDRVEPFHDNDLTNSSDRIFYSDKRAEVGVRWTPRPQVSLQAAIGYAFEQRFDYGWDDRDFTRLARPGDEPYGRVSLEARF